jgi:hypothetical protein
MVYQLKLDSLAGRTTSMFTPPMLRHYQVADEKQGEDGRICWKISQFPARITRGAS